MSKKSSKGGKKKSLGHGHVQSDDELALDLAGPSPPPAKVRHITINDDDDEVHGPAIKATHFPCKGCTEQLVREVDAKLQSRTLPMKTVEVLKYLPYFTAEELVDTIVDSLSPSTIVGPIMSPARVAIADDDHKWRPFKFPEIGFFSGTSLEKIEPWMIPKMTVLCHTTSGILGCAHCKLQSVASNSPVRFFVCIY